MRHDKGRLRDGEEDGEENHPSHWWADSGRFQEGPSQDRCETHRSQDAEEGRQDTTTSRKDYDQARGRWQEDRPAATSQGAGKTIAGTEAGSSTRNQGARSATAGEADACDEETLMAEDSQYDLLTKASDRIRDTAKWIIAAFGAVAGILIAGSQLSNIGKLPAGGRLAVAVAGAVGAVAFVAIGIWVMVDVMLPRSWTLNQLVDEWCNAKSPIKEFFDKNQDLLQGFPSIPAIKEARDEAVAARYVLMKGFKEADSDEKKRVIAKEIDDLDSAIVSIDKRSYDVQDISAFVSLRHYFRRRALLKLLVCAAFVAGGIIAFAWASNPVDTLKGPPSLRGAVLSGADLSGANLHDVDLTGATLENTNLRGANLKNAKIDGVTWRNTTCPDGTSSDAVANTCQGHLVP